MKVEDLKGKKITIMGLGLNSGGVGTVRFLNYLGARLLVTDIKSKEELSPSLEKLKDLKDIEYVLGQHRPEDFEKTDMVIKTPGVPWNNKYVALAISKNIPVEVDSSLFFKLCKNPIIGITGTKGKTTTATLIYEILKTAGKHPIKVGIGQVSVLDKLKEIKKDSVVVFELSSWRLSVLGRYKLSPQISVLTNIYPDHLNYYSGMDAYIKDKKYIFANQKSSDYCIINFDNSDLRKMIPEIKAQIIEFSENKIEDGRSVYLAGDAIYLNNGIDERKIIDVSEIKIKGKHNLCNIMAAIGAGQALGIEIKDISKAILEFKGIPYRLEFLKEINGVKYYNDTAATTPESAISGISAFNEPVILIAGGPDKKLSMAGLAKAIQDKVKGVIFLKGEASQKIIAELKKLMPEKKDEDFRIVESMAKAVEIARGEAENGNVVLLSPGAASFGIFRNEFDRGDKFKEAVNSLK